jgi:selenocysteine lyase/cysteine desulfurase
MSGPILGCQRHLFELPADIAYLNAAAYSPLPRDVRRAGEAGVASKSTPWTPERDGIAEHAEAARVAAARLVGAGADDIAITGAVSYGVAVAGLNIDLPAGTRVLMAEGEFPSQALAWHARAHAAGAVVEAVPRPDDHDWTAALLEAAARPGPPVSVAALTPLHWSDGAVMDLARLVPPLRAKGAAIVIDATQAAGVMALDVSALAPDFLAFPTYKWLLGPYGTAFLYVAPSRQDGMPLEQSGTGRGTGPARADGTPPYLDTARRFDRGERYDLVGLPTAVAGMRQVLAWGPDAVAARLRFLTDALADEAEAAGLEVVPRRFRAPHILGARIPGGMPEGLIAALAAENVHVSDRQGVLRISPHVYNDSADVARFGVALRRRLGR